MNLLYGKHLYYKFIYLLTPHFLSVMYMRAVVKGVDAAAAAV